MAFKNVLVSFMGQNAQSSVADSSKIYPPAWLTAEDRPKPISDWRDSVHEHPESCRDDQSTTEVQRHGEQQRHQVGSVIRDLDSCTSSLSQGTRKAEECNHVEPTESTSLSSSIHGSGVFLQTDWVVPAEVGKGTTNPIVWDLRSDLGEHKSDPAERFRWPFSHLVQRSLGHKLRKHLVNHGQQNDGKHENRKHLVLQALNRSSGIEKGETIEQRRNDS
ncbi:hypothetical protein OGATHE_002473 [Ogataea polymorpha]|uniref:Uncharacterized protein n=1 Tax=Ogataea polymorpha TaxID=460523 RepID=A0A9P8T898_9ASCO|nr:hypothetical protein OGATHE_002473 [Ogataea polymorpha]